MHESQPRPRWVVPMRPRSPDEPHRQSTPLELFFDLVFVVAVAQAASALHHAIAEGHAAEALVSYGLVFFGIWWAWMNFTWFATSYDIDDIPYRLLVFVQMTGALIVASGVEQVFNDRDLTLTVIGYIVMRIANIVQWLRAAQSDPEHRPAALRYVVGLAVTQVAWVILLLLQEYILLPGFIFLAGVEVLIPVWAERAVPTPTPWHVDHIRERYGLFTILVLGESILSTSVAIQSAVNETGMDANLTSIILGGLLIVYTMWWLYFNQTPDNLMSSLRGAFIWGYGHYFIFGASAAVGAGLAVVIDQLTHHSDISPTGAGMAVALPIAIYILSLWVLHEHSMSVNMFDRLLHPVIVILILLTPFTGMAVPLIGILLLILVVMRVMRHLE